MRATEEQVEHILWDYKQRGKSMRALFCRTCKRWEIYRQDMKLVCNNHACYERYRNLTALSPRFHPDIEMKEERDYLCKECRNKLPKCQCEWRQRHLREMKRKAREIRLLAKKQKV